MFTPVVTRERTLFGTGYLPFFGDQKYIDGRVAVKGKSYLVRLITDEQKNFLLMRLPQVLKATEVGKAVM